MVNRTNRYLEGRFGPVDTEVTAFDLPVVGDLPAELCGRYLRNGPNPIAPPDPATHHWFLGDGMIHGIELVDGEARWYRNRWVRSNAVSSALGEDPAPGERHADMDTVNTNVIGHAGRTWALVEAGARPVELGRELDTIAHSDLDGTLPHGYSAHPKLDPVTGELHAIGYHWSRPEVLEHTVWGTDGRIRRRVDVSVDGGPMVHDCSITEDDVLLYDLPVTFDLDAAAGGASFPYRWNDDHGARIGLLPREGGGDGVRWFEVDPCYVFHAVNAHRDGDRTVVDVIRHPRMFATDVHGPNDGPSVPWRWTLDERTGQVVEEQLDDRPVEFPRIDERFTGRRTRFAWTVALTEEDGDMGFDSPGLVRHDLRDRTTARIDLGAGRHPGEAVFVPRSGSVDEGDGWLMTIAHDRETDRGELVVLDALDPDADPVARVLLPVRVPLGFHGNWIPDA